MPGLNFSSRRVRGFLVFIVTLTAAALLPPAVATAGEASVPRFERQLLAGQFQAALETARSTRDRRAHDALLATLAVAQSQANQAQAARQIAAEVYDPATLKKLQAYLEFREHGANPAKSAQGAAGGAAEPDFESLIELITQTIAPNTWQEVGGPGAVDGFAGGVFVDARGTLRPLVRTANPTDALFALRAAGEPAIDAEPGDERRPARLRMISLPRLEKQLQARLAAGEPPSDEMRALAGLQRVKYVFLYPETGDLVLAGPAGDWRADGEDRLVSRAHGLPIVQLDDLVVILRHLRSAPDARFGCSITPTPDALARTQQFLRQSSQTPLKPGQRATWLDQLRAELGQQEIDVFGIDPRTRVARVMVEADYRMKLIGMGLEEGTLGVESYLSALKVPRGQAPPPMDVLRWWFTLNYQALLATPNRDGFEIRGQGVQVLSENELLTARGERVHTGKSDELNQQFAQSFTTHFDALATKYPIYADLRNLFDLALVSALLTSDELPAQLKWDLPVLGNPEAYQVALGPAAKRVETVINHCVIHRVHIVAGVSGGVSVEPGPLVAPSARETDRYGVLSAERHTAQPTQANADRWWWDE